MIFTIDKNYITDVTIRKEWDIFKNVPRDKLTHEQLIRIIKGDSCVCSISSADHPEFAKLRNMLDEQGYIKADRSCWNGDIVLKPFTLNDMKFKENDRFLCAGAMRTSISIARKNIRKYNRKK